MMLRHTRRKDALRTAIALLIAFTAGTIFAAGIMAGEKNMERRSAAPYTGEMIATR